MNKQTTVVARGGDGGDFPPHFTKKTRELHTELSSTSCKPGVIIMRPKLGIQKQR